MGSIILLFTGVVLIGTSVIVYFASFKTGGSMNPALAKNIITLVLGGLGALFTLMGLIGFIGGSKIAKLKKYILQNGSDAEGTVTFIDRNYAFLVNRTPIYSIIEYTYVDPAGADHTRKITNFSTQIAIRKQIQVGSKIAIKYHPENPEESVIVL